MDQKNVRIWTCFTQYAIMHNTCSVFSKTVQIFLTLESKHNKQKKELLKETKKTFHIHRKSRDLLTALPITQIKPSHKI